MTVDLDTFSAWMEVLCDRYRHPLSPSTKALYHEYLSVLTVEQFVKSAEALFKTERDRLPGTDEWIKFARSIQPEEASPPSLPEEFRQPTREDIERARAIALAGVARSPVKSSVMSSMGNVAMRVVKGIAVAEKPISEEIAEKNKWLASGDRILQGEALKWAEVQDAVEIEYDEAGNPQRLKEADF